MEKLWTTAEVAKFLGVAEADVEQLIQQGTLIGYKLGGQFLRFRPDQVEALKGAMAFRANRQKAAGPRKNSWWFSTRDFFYFYDFYLVSALCLAILVIYLIAS